MAGELLLFLLLLPLPSPPLPTVLGIQGRREGRSTPSFLHFIIITIPNEIESSGCVPNGSGRTDSLT